MNRELSIAEEFKETYNNLSEHEKYYIKRKLEDSLYHSLSNSKKIDLLKKTLEQREIDKKTKMNDIISNGIGEKVGLCEVGLMELFGNKKYIKGFYVQVLYDSEIKDNIELFHTFEVNYKGAAFKEGRKLIYQGKFKEITYYDNNPKVIIIKENNTHNKEIRK